MQRKWLIILGAGVAVAILLSAAAVVGVVILASRHSSPKDAARVEVPEPPHERGQSPVSPEPGFTVTVQTGEYAWAARYVPMKIVVIANLADTPLVVKKVSVNGGPPETRIYNTKEAAERLGALPVPASKVDPVALPSTLTIGKSLFVAAKIGDEAVVYVDVETDRGTFHRDLR
jgi:hypothetical protein